jgi:RimJ/RimL family protein N-acetyltransferase
MQPGWERAWGVFDSDRMIGHLDLKTRPLATSAHRAIVGIGIEETHRRMGLGLRLMETAIEWAQSQEQLSWLDLNVFANNEAAVRLYAKCGFVEVGRISDMFRVDGQSMNDIQMVLKLR